MTLESVIEGITKRCKATHSELVERLKKRDELLEHLSHAKQTLAEAVKKGVPENIEYWKQSVKNWRGYIQYACDMIKKCETKETELFFLCKEIGLNYYEIVLNLGGAQ